MLYDKLLNIYQKNSYLSKNYTFDEYYKKLRDYIFDEVNLGNFFLSPYRFSKMFGDELEKVFEFFLAISSPDDNGFIRIYYKYKCENCCSINYFLTSDILNDDLICDNCSDEVYGCQKDQDMFVLTFEASEQLQKEFKSLKLRPLPKSDADTGRGVSFAEASIILMNNPNINPAITETITDYWSIANG